MKGVSEPLVATEVVIHWMPKAPANAPTSERRPPTSTQITTSAAWSSPNTAGFMN